MIDPGALVSESGKRKHSQIEIFSPDDSLRTLNTSGFAPLAWSRLGNAHPVAVAMYIAIAADLDTPALQ